jgi:hypothetical protein
MLRKMGYCIQVVDCDLCIKNENKEKALKILKKLEDRGL